jgi:hypothetical protein
MKDLVGGPCADFDFTDGVLIVGGFFGGVLIPDEAEFWDLPPKEKLLALDRMRIARPLADEAMELLDIIDRWNKQKNHGFAWGEKVRVLSLLARAEYNPFLDEDDKCAANKIIEFYPKTMEVIRDCHVTPSLRSFIISRDGKICHYCGKELELIDIHIDHVFPRSLGGRTHPDNLVVSCKSCNWKKGVKTDWKYQP